MRRIFLVVAVTVTLSACDFVSSAPTPTSAQALLKQIDKGEKKWKKRKIESYHIEVLSVRDIWHLQSHQIVVRNGQVVKASASCSPAPAELGKCEVEPFDAQEYTVSALFARARAEAQKVPGQQTRITFDRRYGFPSWIVTDVPEITDGGHTWKVEAFEVLE